MSWDNPGERSGDRILDALQLHEQWADVPVALDVLPDGREALVIGEIDRFAELSHRQGDNPYGFGGTCGICSCEGVLRQFGVDVSEAELVEHAVRNRECFISNDPAECGKTRVTDQIRIFADFGIPAHLELADSLEDLAQNIEHGRGIILEVNAGVLWADSTYSGDGGPNHAVVAIGIARDPESGRVIGIFINDSGTGQAGRLVDATDLEWAWLDAGGMSVVTDITLSDHRPVEARTHG